MKNHHLLQQDTMKSSSDNSTRKRKNDSTTAKIDGKKIHHHYHHGHNSPSINDHHHHDEGLNLTLTLAYTNEIPKLPIRPPPSDEFNISQFHHQSDQNLISPNSLLNRRSDIDSPPPPPPVQQITPPLSTNNPDLLPVYTHNRTQNNNNTGRKRITKSDNKTVPPPYPWATNRRATVHGLEELTARNIEIVTGLVQCRRCEKQYEIGYNLREKFIEVGSYIANNKEAMHDRAPSVLMSPIYPTCKFCEQENSVKPVISEKKKSINWLFLLLGQMLGCCTLDQLKYFCKHTENHRTGAKDRVLYLTYLGLCKQLDPHGPFHR